MVIVHSNHDFKLHCNKKDGPKSHRHKYLYFAPTIGPLLGRALESTESWPPAGPPLYFQGPTGHLGHKERHLRQRKEKCRPSELWPESDKNISVRPFVSRQFPRN